ncbi:MAG: choice-of-anchor tandem repeat GloVer-containing protein [Candidatus Sulfotelmatobacter sp.]
MLSTLLVAFQPAHAQSEIVLYNFCSQPNCTDGENPASSLMPDGAGNFYSTTQMGGANNYGTVFELSPNGIGGYKETVLYSFCSLSNCTDGSSPGSYVTFDGRGNLYGTAYYGGPFASGPYSGYGVVFQLSPEPGGGCPSGSNSGTGWCETVLYSFLSNPDGAFPFSGLTWDTQGNLYGTTYGGGSGMGAVYELSPNGSGGWSEQVIYNSGGYAGLAIDGYGNLYGADHVNNGHIFKLSPNGSGDWNATIIHTFKGGPNDGSNPEGTPVLDSAGNVYGTTISGGSNLSRAGTVWKLTPLGGEYTEEILQSLLWRDGSSPYAGVVLDSSGNIYGTTGVGVKTSPCYNGCGSVFELAVSGTTYEWKTLWAFTGADGGYASDSLNLNGGNLYGTTFGGGTSSYCPGSDGCGVVFEVNPGAATTSTTLTSSPNPSTHGEDVTFTATVMPAPPDGETINFIKGTMVLGTGSLSGGSATFMTATLPVGTSKISAVYAGDINFAGSTSAVDKQVVNRAVLHNILSAFQSTEK